MRRPIQIRISMPPDGSTVGRAYLIQSIIEEILAGRLQPRTQMPSTRMMAEHFQINRKTVVASYEELVAQGWLESHSKRGTFVSSHLPVSIGLPPTATDTRQPASRTSSALKLYGAPFMWPKQQEEGTINFDDGVPDTRLIPYEALSRAFRHSLIATTRHQLLGYGDPRGAEALRLALSEMLNAERGLATGPDGICIARGSQMGIFLVARVLVRQGDGVAFERLSYGPARKAFEACGAKLHHVDQDEQGLIPDSLEKLCRKHSIKAIYVTPHHQFPTTVMMPAQRRLRLLELAEQFGFAIVEDDYDHEFHFDRQPMLPIAAFDRYHKVIYVGSLSKVLAPGLRIGYVVASPDIINRCANEIMLLDRQGSMVTELAVAELISTGELRRLIWRAMRVYINRRQAMADALATQLSEWTNFTLPVGGLAFWLRLISPIDPDVLASHALACGVRVLSSSQFGHGSNLSKGFRLGFGSNDEATIYKGVQRFRKAFITVAKAN
ncbi:MAG: PLP-dependent aminotransferase family protein [Thiobacillus sp.]